MKILLNFWKIPTIKLNKPNTHRFTNPNEHISALTKTAKLFCRLLSGQCETVCVCVYVYSY